MPRYSNADPAHRPHTFGEVFRWAVWDRLTGRRRVAAPGAPMGRRVPDPEAVHATDVATRVTWIGHASFLMRIGGANLLVDPVFSRRIGWLYRRHGEPGLEAAELPPIDGLLVTHNHYDHLDEPSVLALPREAPVATAPGLGGWFRRRGFERVIELGWWDSTEVAGLRVTAAPARHWSRRSFFDVNRTGWVGFVVEGEGGTLYHAGDSAAFPGFAEIGRRFPGLDAALVPIGAYAPAWFMEPSHLNPEQAGEAFLATGARALVPMHYGSFQLTDEPLCEPLERLRAWWDPRRLEGRELRVLEVGETATFAPR